MKTKTTLCQIMGPISGQFPQLPPLPPSQNQLKWGLTPRIIKPKSFLHEK